MLRRVDQRAPGLRIPFPDRFADRLTGRRVTAIRRRAKYILLDLDDGETLIAHLGMSGRMFIVAGPPPAPEKHDHVLFETEAGETVIFNDTRRFGLMTLCPTADLESHKLLRGIGPEPLGNGFNGPYLSDVLRGRKTPIKAALLDQAVVAGVGNIYACEALYRARISPRRLAASVAGVRAERLAAAVKAVLVEAIEAGGSSLRDYVQASGELGYFQHRFAVYDREGRPCPNCDTARPAAAKPCTVRRIVQSGRSTFYCPVLQR
jgi:formamidopyrimidine-DNA glycosylase